MKRFVAGVPKLSKWRTALRILRACAAWLLVCGLLQPYPASAYAVLAHEAIIDAAWDTNIKAVLLARFPGATPDELSEAQAYAYGGSIIQDMGYYPYGSHFFSDLTHYVRSGDFVLALLRDARDMDEYGFAVGALAHYAADNNGHRLATNRAVPLLYPRLRKKYGDTITYEQDPLAHTKTEFGFDVLEVAHETYAPDGYHDFIGFEISQDLLERAFQQTYGLELSDVLMNEDKALGSYRHAVSRTIPMATKVAWSLKKDEIKADLPGMTKRKFRYNLSRSSYEHEWGKNYQKPNLAQKFLAFLYRLIPKFGPLRVLDFHTPTPEAQRMFRASFNATLDRYRKLLTELQAGNLQLPNDNFDVGETTGPGVYVMNDDAHAELLDKLAALKFAGMTSGLKTAILQFYADPSAPYATRRNAKEWAQIQSELNVLKNVGDSAPAATFH
ncbi:MAG TPA: zinc dependent phospholipase C family protein [Candidatus Acidoferrum sp.]|nr:zinc dependent phospholipase C family protein [Candidatus Acidoferrum sp.]